MTASFDRLLEELRSIRESLGAFSPPESLAESLEVGSLLEPCEGLIRRIEDGPAAPLRIALFGPTGAGKSKVFNSILAESISPSGFLRPFTRRSVYFVHESLRDQIGELEGEVRWHSRDDWKSRVLIDTPDFDGVEDPNHAVAERVYLTTDVLVFLTDVNKYADAATWEYIHRLRRESRPSIFVINKVRGEGPDEDFRRRLLEAFGEEADLGEVLTIQHHAQEDARLLPADDPGLQALCERVEGVSRERRDLLVKSFQWDFGRLAREWETFRGRLEAVRETTSRLRDELHRSHDDAYRRFDDMLESRVDPVLKERVYQEVLQRLEQVDVLRYPRQLLALPAQGVRRLLGRFFPSLKGGDASSGRGEPDPAADPNLPALESVVVDLTEGFIEKARAEETVRLALDDDAVQSFRLGHDEIVELYRERSAEYREWARNQAGELASQLAGEHKLKFILSQVLFNSVLIGVQVKTGGLLTLGEILADGVISPLAAKLVGMAISSQQVKAFEDAARKRHRELSGSILALVRDRIDAFLKTRLEPELPDFETLRSAVEELSRDRDSWVHRYRDWVLEETGESIPTPEGGTP